MGTLASELDAMTRSTVFGLVDRVARLRPARVAVIDEAGETTYAALASESQRLAGVFAEHGVGIGTRVGLWLPNSSFWLAAHLGLARLGAIAVGINSRYPVAEVVRIVTAADISALIVDLGSAGLADAASLDAVVAASGHAIGTVFTRGESVELARDVTCVDSRIAACCAGAIGTSATVPFDPGAGFAVFASSGSTGAPKLILHSQQGIAAQSEAIATSFGYDRPDVAVLAQLPMCGVWGFNTVYAALAGGATVVSMERFEAKAAVALIDRTKVTTANGPDLFVRRLLAAAGEAGSDLSSFECVGFSTFSNDSRELVDMGDAWGIRLFQVYGSSEQQALMLHQDVTANAETRADPGGLPSNPETHVRVRDPETGALADFGAAGQLETCGPNIMLGYLGPAGIDRSAFTPDGWLRTGDVAQLTEAGGARYLSREKDVLRLSGFLVDPQEIERHLECDPTVVEAKVVAIDTPRGPRCVAFVRPVDAANFDPDRLRTRCVAELASYKVPSAIYAVEDYPRVDGANGPRIHRLALRELAITLRGQE